MPIWNYANVDRLSEAIPTKDNEERSNNTEGVTRKRRVMADMTVLVSCHTVSGQLESTTTSLRISKEI
jgi:hypothetical protein